jgi:outer membrane lipoprotein-sorting protein
VAHFPWATITVHEKKELFVLPDCGKVPPLPMRLARLVSPLLALTFVTQAQEPPDAQAILKTVRSAQTTQDLSVTGQVRTGAKKIPFKLTMKDGAVRWEFQDPPEILTLRLGEKNSTLSDAKGPIASKRLDDPVRASGITYEDLALRFLYWPEAAVEGEQTILLQKCWQLLLRPGGMASSYARVRVWISQENGALLKAETFDRDDKLARTFRVVSGQKTADGLWILKSMRIEPAGARSGTERTYLEIDPVR